MAGPDICIGCNIVINKCYQGAVYCRECRAIATAETKAAQNELHKRQPLQRNALYTVRNAVRKGEIIPAREYKCVDCGKQAEHYDHRDYEKPLNIEPVCVSCNVRRGPAEPYRSNKPCFQ